MLFMQEVMQTSTELKVLFFLLMILMITLIVTDTGILSSEYGILENFSLQTHESCHIFYILPSCTNTVDLLYTNNWKVAFAKMILVAILSFTVSCICIYIS